MTMRKIKINGQAVIYTDDGVKVIPAEVLGLFNVHCDVYRIRFDTPEKYLLIGGARTTFEGHENAARLKPETIPQMINFTRTKFFRFMLDLMRMAQFDPIHKANYFFGLECFRHDNLKSDIDFSASVEEMDKAFYQKYKFTPAMIKFIEERYFYDDVRLGVS